ncbi:hypothetical protein [Streptomyces milbemycinicus]|uniref:M61 family metallopeptidase n=1 Tax=Streptomyces milbemycinicus TaxID=476552 RepID=UPI0033CA76C7
MTAPSITITLEPQVTGGAATGVGVSYVLCGVDLAEGDTLCRLPEIVVGVDGARVADEGVRASDEAGPLKLVHHKDEATPAYTYRRWQTNRATQGDITVEYFAPVRVVTPATTNGPLFDLRVEGQGISGGGVTFLALPEHEGDFDTEVGWDLRQLPPGSRGVTSHGEGTVRRTATLESLTYTFYIAGGIGSYPAEPDGTFGMLWLSEPKFDAVDVGAHIKRLYDEMCAFFREPAPGYRVFVRKHPFPGNGGSAFPGSRGFMFGWSEAEQQSTEALKRLLAHETVHNWPFLQGEPADISWYTEGTAEYYSLVLPHRSGVIDDNTFLELLNARAHGYYGNPLQTLTNDEAATRYWGDWRAQKVPYGRGLFYLIDLDHKIRRTSQRRRGVDDLVLDVLERQRAGQHVTTEDWVAMVVEELGEAGRLDFKAMTAGQWILPDLDCLGPRFVAQEVDIRQLHVGFDYSSFKAGAISGLVEDGHAARAGIRDGDIIVKAPAPHKLPGKPVGEITLMLRRGEDLLDITYKPQGALVTGRLWDLKATS